MKKTLLLSVVASTMIMAGGDIAPVEPVVVAEEVSAWEFSGSAVAYTQTVDLQGTGDLFSGNSTGGLLGLSLRATNSDVFAGIGFGAEVTATGTGNGYANHGRNYFVQSGNALTQGYLTYGADSINTSLKVGRQHLPKGLSPFAFTEGWQAIKNSFDSALIVNSSLPATTLVYAYVTKANGSLDDINDFNHINDDDGVHMVTAQNKSFDNLTLTGTWYMAPDMLGLLDTQDANILWGDATYAADMFTIGVQGGTVMGADDLLVGKDTTAFGAKIAGNLGMFSLMAAYSSVDDGTVSIHNLGTGVKTPLYTQSVANQNAIKSDSDAIKVAAGMKALGGKFGLAYVYADMGTTALATNFHNFNSSDGTVSGLSGEGEYSEVDFTYKTKVGENTTLFAAYVYQDDDRLVDSQNFVRFWARYNFN